MPMGWRPSWRPSARRRRPARRPTSSTPATTCSSPRRWWRAPSVRRMPAWWSTPASWCRSSARHAPRRWAPSSARSRPSGCARCCSPSRRTCGWCCCAWPRGCRPCATMQLCKRPCPPELAQRVAAGLRAAGQPARHLADQVGDRGPGLPLPAARRLPRGGAAAGRAPGRARAARGGLPRGPRRAARDRQGLAAEVQGRPKHLYSIWKKMRGKALDIEQVFDLRAVRVLVDAVADCYAALSRVHARWKPVEGEFDDYIARPKPKWLPVIAHRGSRRRRPPGGSADPHPRDACPCRTRRGGPLGLQGGRRQGLWRRQQRWPSPMRSWPRRARPCSASCWRGKKISPRGPATPHPGPRWPMPRWPTRASTCSRRRPPWWTCRPAVQARGADHADRAQHLALARHIGRRDHRGTRKRKQARLRSDDRCARPRRHERRPAGRSAGPSAPGRRTA